MRELADTFGRKALARPPKGRLTLLSKPHPVNGVLKFGKWAYIIEPLMANIDEVRQAQSELLNELYKQVSKTFNYQLQHGIVYLAKSGISVTLMSRAFGLTPARIYQIIDKFDKEEINVLEDKDNE
jgi:hypothetical protein